MSGLGPSYLDGPVAANPPSGSTLTPPIVVPATANAPQSYRLMGGTTTGAPSAGAWNPGDPVFSQDGNIWISKGLLYPATILAETGLLAYYRMDDVGTSLVDQKGLGNGTLHGGITTGAAGAITDGDAAMAFNGTTGFIDSFPAGLTFSAYPLSVEFWATMPAFSSQHFLLGNTDNSPTVFNYCVDLNAAGSFRFRSGNGSLTKTSSGLDDGTWHHWVCTVSAAGALSIFKDGSLVAGPTGAVTIGTAGVSLSLGRTGPRNAQYFNGSLDEVAFYNVELTAAQALAHYNAGVASFFYKFVRPGEVDATVAHLAGTETLSGPKTFAAITDFQQALELTKIAAPAAPASGLDRVWVDTTSGALSFMGSDAQAIPVASGMIANPRTYLGKGDGIADDTTPLNNAYAAAGEGLKNMLYIPGGSWKYTSQLAWNPGSKDVLILGAGIQVTELKPTAFGGSSLVLNNHSSGATEIGHLGITGPGTYANPSTNPGNTAGVDGLELASAIPGSWLRIQNCGAGLVISGVGGHKRIFHSSITSNYYNVYQKYTGGDDFFIDMQNPSPMFACFYTDDTDTTEDLGFSLGVIRVHCNALPFVFYQSALVSKTNFVSDLFAHHFSLEQVCNGFMYAASFATKGNAYNLHFVTCGTMSTNAGFQRSDSPHDYMVVMGQGTGGACFFWGWPTQSLDKGFLFSQNEFFNDWHFHGAATTGAVLNFNGGAGQQLKWHPARTDGMQGSASFAAASGNNATKVIGANSWPGSPASVNLQLTPTTDGGLTNGFNLVGGTVRATPTLTVPQAPAPALITAAGNIDAGNHTYKFIHRTTGINGRAGGSGPSVATASVTNDASHAQNTVNLPTNGITPVGAPTVTIEAYRNKIADQTHWFAVQTGIALGTASVVDNLADASLGAAMPTVADDVAWDATVTLKTTAGQTGNPSFNWKLTNQ